MEERDIFLPLSYHQMIKIALVGLEPQHYFEKLMDTLSFLNAMLQDNLCLRQLRVHSYPIRAINMYITDEKQSKLLMFLSIKNFTPTQIC